MNIPLPFIGIGVESKKCCERQSNSGVGKTLLISIVLFFSINFLSMKLGYSIVYYADIVFDNILFTLILGLSGSIIVIVISQKLSGFVENWLIYCGQNNLIIYGAHYVVLEIVFQILKRVYTPVTSGGGELFLFYLKQA